MPFLNWLRLNFLTAKVALCPAHALATGRRLFMMLLICTGTNLPRESGPMTRLLRTVISPRSIVPATTAPTPVTWKVSSTWNSPGEPGASGSVLGGRRLRSMRTRLRSAPVTELVRKMGATRWSLESEREAESTSPSLRTTRGILRTPGERRILERSSMVCWRMLGGHMSTLVTTNSRGSLRARATPRCSRVMRSTPMLAPTTTIAYPGRLPVMPVTVVLMYFSCPARSMNVITFALLSTISVHE
mmetsp:Transcript_13862/g.32138  ORF Transcript_13862/g.32138 Transcript_13862/m.32138 type:complete len:245 (+) Transcript_13862:610-1344(+)